MPIEEIVKFVYEYVRAKKLKLISRSNCGLGQRIAAINLCVTMYAYVFTFQGHVLPQYYNISLDSTTVDICENFVSTLKLAIIPQNRRIDYSAMT